MELRVTAKAQFVQVPPLDVAHANRGTTWLAFGNLCIAQKAAICDDGR